MTFPSLSTCVCPTSELFSHVLSSLHLLHKSSWFRTLQAPQCSSGCLCPSYFPQQYRRLPELCFPHIANLEDAFIRDYSITSKKDGRRERPLTGMVFRLLTEGSMLLYQQKGERFEVLHLKITLGCFTKAWSKKGRRYEVPCREHQCVLGVRAVPPPSILVTSFSVFALLYPS